MSKKIGIGIIGTGFARSTQIPAFQMTDGAKVVSVSSARLEKAETTAREFGIPHFSGDWRETIEHKDVDLVCVTTPPKLHLEMTLAALDAGKAVLCEKPMAMNFAEAAQMLEKARQTNAFALIDHELRFQNGRQKAFEMIRCGEIGQIRHAKYNFRAPHRGNPSTNWTWWNDAAQGGGVLGAIGSHAIDTLRWFGATEVSEVFCQLQTHIKERPHGADGAKKPVTSDDEAQIFFRFADSEWTADATANVSLSVVEQPIYQNRVELFGTKGALRVEFDGAVFYGANGADKWQPVAVELGEAVPNINETGWSRGFIKFAERIVKALQNGENTVEGAANFEDGAQIQKVLDAAHESNRAGVKIKLS